MTMTYKVLGISGSPRKDSNSSILVKKALEGASEVFGIETEFISLAGKKIMPCIGCFKCVEKGELCIFRDKDYMGEFYKKWFYADAVIIGSPVYHLAVPGVLKNVIDRLGEGIWALKKSGNLRSNWFCKVGGVLTQGLANFGGQEYVAQYLVNHLLLMNCLPVAAENVTVPGVVGTFYDNKVLEPGRIEEFHPIAVDNAVIMGRRVAEILKIVKSGVNSLSEELPQEYSDYVLTQSGYDEIIKSNY